jgi:CHAT domain-containing protein
LTYSASRCVIAILGELNGNKYFQSAAGLDRPRVWWCVTGELTFLPIHAAGITQNSILETAADYFVSSYVPTLAALINCRVNWSPIPVNEVTGILAACRDSPHQAPLHNVACEIDGVAVRFREASAQVLHSFSPNSEAQLLRDVLANNSAHILHLACHSVQRAENPLDSAFLLSDGCLSIQDFMEIRPPDAVLAFLSACQTARGNDIVPDEAVHLAASMLFCGFKSVVATMW